MKVLTALEIISKYAPCPHATVDRRLGDGNTWAYCEDCGETIKQESLPAYKRDAKAFELALRRLEKVAANSKTKGA